MTTTEETREGFYLSEDGEWIPEGWELKTVGSLIDEDAIERPIDGNHGNDHPKGNDFKLSGVPFIMASNLQNGKVNQSDCSFIAREQADALRKGFAKTGDILLSHKATIGRVARLRTPHDYVMLTPQVTYYRVKDPTKLLPDFLYYHFSSSRFQNTLYTLADAGSTRAYLGITAQRELSIIAPQIAEQKAIAAVLGSLDEKIELLREQNETLEALAQTLFKRWFIGFNFLDENGNPYKDSGGKMMPSEFGEIPEGWKVGSISLFAEHIKNSISPDKSPDTLFHHYSIPSFDDGMKPVLEKGSEIKSNKYEVIASSILVSKLNPGTPRIWQIQEVVENSVCSTEFQVVKPQKEYFSFVYGALMSSPVRRELTGRAHGTSSSHQRVSPADIFEVPFPVSSDGKLEKAFSQTTHGLLIKSDENRAQIQTLTKLRDTLLPKLMKGEIRIPVES